MCKKQTIEESLRRLEEIIAQLEEPNITLDESLALFEEGVKISHKCTEELDHAKQVIEQRKLEF